MMGSTGLDLGSASTPVLLPPAHVTSVLDLFHCVLAVFLSGIALFQNLQYPGPSTVTWASSSQLHAMVSLGLFPGSPTIISSAWIHGLSIAVEQVFLYHSHLLLLHTIP